MIFMSNIKTKTKLVQWGNSKATRLPKEVIDTLNIQVDQSILVEVIDNSIVMTPVNEAPNSIHDLFKDWKDDGIRSEELDWGESKGAELNW